MLYDRWRQIARNHANELALADHATGRRWTFVQLAQAAEGVRLPDDAVVCPRGNTPEFILEVLAAWRAGRPVLPLEVAQPDLASLLNLCTPSASAPQAAQFVHFKSTSGTTGKRQLIAFTAGQLAADADNIVITMGLRPDWPNLGVISLAHSYGFSNLVTPLLLHGIPLNLCSSPMPEVVKAAASLAPALTLPAVPAMWRAWHEANAIPPNVRLAISAGAPLPLELETSVFQQHGLKLHNFYGSSECGGIAYDRSAVPRVGPLFAGEALENVSLAIGDDGCLVVRGAAVGESYLPADSPRLGGGQFQTNDLVELRADGVYLRGRLSDVINIAGRKLSPESIEAVIRRQPGVRECVIVGVPARDSVRSEEVLAVVALENGAALEEVRRKTGATLAAWQCPRHWWAVPELPVSGRGKISRREWRERFLAR